MPKVETRNLFPRVISGEGLRKLLVERLDAISTEIMESYKRLDSLVATKEDCITLMVTLQVGDSSAFNVECRQVKGVIDHIVYLEQLKETLRRTETGLDLSVNYVLSEEDIKRLVL